MTLAQDEGTQPSDSPPRLRLHGGPDPELLRGRMGPGGFDWRLPGRRSPGFGLGGVSERGLGFLGLPAEGSTVTATFFDGDPEAGGAQRQSLSFTLGTDSETAFRTAYQEAAEGATHVRITISPQERTFELRPTAEPEANLFG